MTARDEIVSFCSAILEAERYQDIALNGLQVEGACEIRRLSVAVSANQHSINAAESNGSQALLVHHGLILGDRIGPIRGMIRRRLRTLLTNEINLIGYHLPLDGHPVMGNNAQLRERLNLVDPEPFGEIAGVPIGVIAHTDKDCSLDDLARRLEQLTEQGATLIGNGNAWIRRVAIASGSGYSLVQEAAAKNCDVLVTGDVREPTMAEARELGISVLVGGHEATERLGVQALAERINAEFGVSFEYIHDPNPA